MNPHTGEIRRAGDYEDDPEFRELPEDMQKIVRLRMQAAEMLSSTTQRPTVRSITANLRNPASPLAQWARDQREAGRAKAAKTAKRRAKAAAESKRRNRNGKR